MEDNLKKSLILLDEIIEILVEECEFDYPKAIYDMRYFYKWFIKDDKIYSADDESYEFKSNEIYRIQIMNDYIIVQKALDRNIYIYETKNEIKDAQEKMYYYNISRGKKYDSLNSIYCDSCWNIISRFDKSNYEQSVVKGDVKCNDCGKVVEPTEENIYLFNGLKYDDYLLELKYPY